MMPDYTPLGPRQIRVLTVEAAPHLDDPVVCGLHVKSLDDGASYNAISYVWGDPKDTTEVTIDGKATVVRVNLATALRDIREKYGRTVLWADAVCINQIDKVEKSRQVLLMRDVYSKSARVIGWIGPAADDSALAMDVLRRVHRARLKYVIKMSKSERWDDVAAATSTSHAWTDFGWVSMIPQLHSQIWRGGGAWTLGSLLKHRDGRHLAWMFNPKFGTMSPAWQAIYDLFKREYWERIWIIQEVILAQNFVLMCGPDVLEKHATEALSSMLGVLQACERGQRPNKMCVAAYAKLGNDTVWKPAYTTLEMLDQPDTGRSLIDLVARFRFHKAEDPRDRIYALLGLSNEKVVPT